MGATWFLFVDMQVERLYINPERPLGSQYQPIRRAQSQIGAAATEDDLEKSAVAVTAVYEEVG